MSIRPLLLALLAVALSVPASAQTEEPVIEPAPQPAAEAAVEPTPTPDVEPTPEPIPAEEVAPEEAAAAPAVEPALVIGDEIAPSVSRDRDTLSVDFPDEEIRNILRNVADLFELNLVIPDTLQGSTSIKLRDVTWRQIFEVVLSPVGYTYVEEGNIIKIVSQESLSLEPVTTDVFIINYANAGELVASIAPLVDPAAGGKIVVDKRSNALVITERPTRLTRIRPIIEQLDKATDQVMIESKFVEVTDRDMKNIGVDWASLEGWGVGVRPGGEDGEFGSFTRSRGQEFETGGSNQGTNRTTTGGNTTTTSGSNLANSSSNTTTVASSATGVTTNGSTTTSTTIENTSGTTSTSQNGSEISSIADSLSSLVNSGGTERITSAVFNADQFGLIISALQRQNEIKLVSNPTVVTLNNTQAQILIGQKYPVAKPQYNQETGQIYYDIETTDIGVQLLVTPQVNSRGFIRLKVRPIVSSLAGTATIPGGAEYPIIATREAQTEVSLKDGYTMGIGGLIENSTSNGESKVPVLGSIPGLGRLFRSNTRSEDKRNLVIFITAKTVSAEGAAIEDVFDPRAIRDMGLRPEDLPGFRDGTDPFEQLPETASVKR